MNNHAPLRLLLGPQRPTVNLVTAMVDAGLEARKFAVISAGWQEAESDIDDVREIIGRPATDLRLYARTEKLLGEHTECREAYRQRQDKLQEQQRLYRLRLKQLAIAARQTLKATGDRKMLAAERRHAIAQLCALDRHHLRRTEAIYQAFEESYNAVTMPELAKHRGEIAAIIGDNDAVIITGGNVAILLNRLRLFGMADLLESTPVVGWSAGAMVLSSRIVLFHDRMPQGRRDAEVFGAGLGLVRGQVFLPDPAGRLRERDQSRVSLMARRFAPDTCVTLASGAALAFEGSDLILSSGVRKLGKKGRLSGLRAA